MGSEDSSGGTVQDSTDTDGASCFARDLLTGQVALVTGGATGIGKEICRVLGAHGARITMASRKRENLEAAVDELRADGIDASLGVCDVRNADAVRAVVDQVVEAGGRLDIVVNNAAGNFPAPMSKISPNGFKAVVDIDLLGTYNVTRAAFDAWLRDHGGSIVNISAPFEQRGVVYQAHVAAAKSGVDSLTRTCAVEWGPYGIRVNAIAPGSMSNTEGVRRFADAVPGASDRPTNPLGLHGQGADIGYLTLFLCSAAARFVSGQVIAVDGAGATDMLRMQAGQI
ncbi:MAG: SDR family oxidoreductase [Acidimicrobiales bacterium]|jgi:peroxisomal 2,4-dienoyl-CoA reductase